MGERIKQLYRDAGLTPPKGRGIHTERAHKAVIGYLKQGLSKDEAWKRVIGGMGKHAINPSHRRETAEPPRPRKSASPASGPTTAQPM